MGEFFNHNSAWIIGALVYGVAVLFAWDRRRSWRSLVAIGLVVAVLTAGYVTSRHGPSDVGSIAAVDAVLASEQPVVLEFYSDT